MSQPRITGIHHYALHVRDLRRSIAFWTETLGFKVKLHWNVGAEREAVMLDTGDGNYLEMFQRTDLGEEPAAGWKNDEAISHIALRCTGLEALVEKARAAGMNILTEPTDAAINNTSDAAPAEVPIRIAFFNGPDGEVIELFENELT